MSKERKKGAREQGNHLRTVSLCFLLFVNSQKDGHPVEIMWPGTEPTTTKYDCSGIKGPSKSTNKPTGSLKLNVSTARARRCSTNA